MTVPTALRGETFAFDPCGHGGSNKLKFQVALLRSPP
jgi:hypothetical protein